MAEKPSKNKPGKKTTQNRKPVNSLLWVSAGALAVVVLVVIGILMRNNQAAYPAEISVAEAYQKYQAGTFLLDVRTQQEWDEYHAPNTTLIPLDQLEKRLSELPRDQEIVVVCRSGNRSQTGRDILSKAGFEKATSMTGGLSQWRAAGYPVEP